MQEVRGGWYSGFQVTGMIRGDLGGGGGGAQVFDSGIVLGRKENLTSIFRVA